MAEEVAEVVEPALESIKQVDAMDAGAFVEWLHSEGANIVEFDGGSEWTLIDKVDLIDVPFIVARLRFNSSDNGDFVSVCAFLEDGKKVVFNDGSTGIYKQLQVYVSRHPQLTGIACKGLRASDYDFVDQETGKKRPARTYYIL